MYGEREDEPEFARGDADGGGAIEISDAILVLSYLFLGTKQLNCLDAADANDDGAVNLSDPVATLSYLFLGGATPPAPGPPDSCGPDPTEDGLARCDGACR